MCTFRISDCRITYVPLNSTEIIFLLDLYGSSNDQVVFKVNEYDHQTIFSKCYIPRQLLCVVGVITKITLNW